jgi:phage recombination protein Bet
MTMANKPVIRTLMAQRQVAEDAVVRWEDRQGTQLALTIADVRELFPSKYPFTAGEMITFLQQCRTMGANPFLREVHLIKYDANAPAQIVTGYHYFIRRAQENPTYDGFELWYVNAGGERIPDGLETKENVVAAVCQVFNRSRSHPTRFVARMAEFNKRQAQWTQMPVHMLGKCAIGNAHRQADPGLGGMYLEEEVAGNGQILDAESRELPQTPVEEAQPPETPPDQVARPVQEAEAPAEGPDPWSGIEATPEAQEGQAETPPAVDDVRSDPTPGIQAEFVRRGLATPPRQAALYGQWARETKLNPVLPRWTDLDGDQREAFLNWLLSQ